MVLTLTKHCLLVNNKSPYFIRPIRVPEGGTTAPLARIDSNGGASCRQLNLLATPSEPYSRPETIANGLQHRSGRISELSFSVAAIFLFYPLPPPHSPLFVDRVANLTVLSLKNVVLSQFFFIKTVGRKLACVSMNMCHTDEVTFLVIAKAGSAITANQSPVIMLSYTAVCYCEQRTH